MRQFSRVKARNDVFWVQRGCCAYCRRPMSLDQDDADTYATWDEVIPRSRGGSLSRYNRVLACRRCNENKGKDLWEPSPDTPRRETGPTIPHWSDDEE